MNGRGTTTDFSKSGFCSPCFPGLAGRFQFSVTFFENLFIFAVQLVYWSNISNGAVEPYRGLRISTAC
ncbi:MAG: hypothetical protein VR65_06990 [Desulfobulbaceae bacterium BRH_c16a]|nr:MAG: hypothetical protein VR65_06990 [Desulfobulbaceae bacterium BRH_c16a]